MNEKKRQLQYQQMVCPDEFDSEDYIPLDTRKLLLDTLFVNENFNQPKTQINADENVP